jgi:D-threo-aldose 1-dehydrogenase
MTTRRNFLNTAALATMAATCQLNAAEKKSKHFKPSVRFGLGGVAIGNGFEVNPDDVAEKAMEAAWDAGVRYFDTSPWYGLGISERRFGHFLDGKKPDDYLISTKVGRLLIPDPNFKHAMWKGDLGFNYKYDYTADGTRRSIEDSLQRMGLSSIDIVFIHDLSPDNADMKEKWTEHFEVAAKGAIPTLTKMREEGIIKGWGLGVNTPQPILKTLEIADPDIFLAATQYSLIDHEAALDKLFPAVEAKGVSLVMGAPLNSGFLAGVDRYNYSTNIPAGHKEKRDKISAIAKEHGTDLRTAAIQFTAAPSVVAATIPGARNEKQAKENAASIAAKIPLEFWEALKKEQLISRNAPVPS